MDVESVVIHTGRGGKYHRAQRDLETGDLLIAPGCRVNPNSADLSEYPELPEEVDVAELHDRCFLRGE